MNERRQNKKANYISDFWRDYLKDDYFDSNGHLRIDYISFAQMSNMAQKMAEAGLSKSQMRRFFSHCRTLEIQLKGGAEWDSIRPDFLKLRYVAAHASKQVASNLPTLFFDFISRNVDKVQTKESFLKGFMPHFEALVGFAALYLNR
ncbi:MAG: type III-A CRISPR-associated protein Csm2 [Acidobacteriota bacterium]